MAFRELTMIDVKEVLRRWSAGHSDRRISREALVDRKTAARYTAVAASLFERGRELSDDEVHEVAQRVQARPLPPTSTERSEVARYRPLIERWLAGDTETRPLRLSKIHTLLVRDHGLKASYDTLWRFAHAELEWREKPATVRIDDAPPGQEAQIDFGKMGLIAADDESGKKRVLWALIITLVYSRYQFVWPTFRQTTEAVCEGLDRAWMFFGGIARTLVPDNMKAIVLDPDALAPTLVPAFLDYVQARGIFVDPARVRSPKDKPRVENQVAFVRESWFDGEQFTDLAHARESAAHWCRDVAGTRVHGTTRKVPREVFASVESAEMLPAPGALYDVPLYIDSAKVHPDHHIQVGQALYSVPNRYLRKHVRVRADRSTVKIYLGTELIKMHERQPAGGRSTDPADYPASKALYALRDVDALRAKAREKGEHIGVYAERLLGGPLPWTKMRQAYALLALCEKHGAGRVEAMCQSALAFDVVNVAKVAAMLRSAAKVPLAPASSKVVQLPLPRFVRPSEQFVTTSAPASVESTGSKEGV